MARFNSATAREMAAKSHAARLQRLASGTQAAETFPQTPQGGPHEAPGAYVSRRLARVRAQLDLVDKAFETEATKANPDGQRLNWFAQAQERLSEQERLLSGRPLPGSRRPGKEGAGRKSDWWIEMQPALPAPQVPKDGLPDPLPVEPPTPAPTAPGTPRPAPAVPVAIEPVPAKPADAPPPPKESLSEPLPAPAPSHTCPNTQPQTHTDGVPSGTSPASPPAAPAAFPPTPRPLPIATALQARPAAASPARHSPVILPPPAGTRGKTRVMGLDGRMYWQ